MSQTIKKGKKAEKQKTKKAAVIELSKDATLILKKDTTNDDLMLAFGMICQIYIMSELQNNKKCDKEKLKQTICGYVDKIDEAIHEVEDGK